MWTTTASASKSLRDQIARCRSSTSHSTAGTDCEEQDTKEARDWLGIVRRSLRCRRQYAIFSGPLKLTKVSSRDIQARSPKLPVRARAARQVLRYPSQRSPERSKLEIPRYSAVRDLIQLSIY